MLGFRCTTGLKRAGGVCVERRIVSPRPTAALCAATTCRRSASTCLSPRRATPRGVVMRTPSAYSRHAGRVASRRAMTGSQPSLPSRPCGAGWSSASRAAQAERRSTGRSGHPRETIGRMPRGLKRVVGRPKSCLVPPARSPEPAPEPEPEPVPRAPARRSGIRARARRTDRPHGRVPRCRRSPCCARTCGAG